MTNIIEMVHRKYIGILVTLIGVIFLFPANAPCFEFSLGENYFDFTGFVGTGASARLSDVDDVQIGFNTYERPGLVNQINKLRFSVYGTHPRDISSQVTLDLLYTSQPNRPFAERGEVLLDEAYLDFLWKDADIRLGLQKVIWGKADQISPFDILTARDFMDPFALPTLEDRIAQPGVRVNLVRGDYTIEAVVFPVWIRSRVPLAETDKNGDTRVDEWFPPMAIYPADGTYIDDPNVNLVWMIFLPTYNPLKKPKLNPSTASFGLKVNTLKGDYDIDFYVVSAMDPVPTAETRTVLATGTIPEANLNDTGLLISMEGNAEFTRMTSVGVAGARTLGAFALRSEMAFIFGKQYFRLFDPYLIEEALNEALNYGFGEVRGSPKSHSEFMWIMGTDYEIPGTFILTSVQLAVTKRFSHEDFYTQGATDVDLTFMLQKGFKDDHLSVSFAGMAGFKSKAVWISPAVSYSPPSYEDIQFSARLNAFAGEDFSKIGMYGDESSLVLSLRWLY